MIYGHGKGSHKVLRLAAYKAARRFAARRLNARGRRDAWSPMVLRWRLRRSRVQNVLAGRAAPQTQASWFPQFHFHFASLLSGRTRPGPIPDLSPATDSQRKRVVMDHRWTSVPGVTRALQLDHAKPPPREIVERKGSSAKENAPVPPAPRVFWPRNSAQPKEHFSVMVRPQVWWLSRSARSKEHAPLTATPQVSWPPLASQLITWPTQRRRRQLLESTLEVRKTMQREVQTHFLQTRSQIWQHWHQVFSLSRSKFSDPVWHRGAENKALQFQYERPEELVWRRRLQIPLTGDDIPGAEPSAPVGRTQSRSHQAFESAVGVAPLLEKAVATQVAKLDPGVLDRLTDDVIRRVEQRMRIERERRGL